jgi:hypothetical protein
MLNPWLAITFQAARLGWEVQNAMARRMMGLEGSSITEPRDLGDDIAEPLPPVATPEIISNSSKRRPAASAMVKVHKKRTRPVGRKVKTKR